jgi:hypothetical protein
MADKIIEIGVKTNIPEVTQDFKELNDQIQDTNDGLNSIQSSVDSSAGNIKKVTQATQDHSQAVKKNTQGVLENGGAVGILNELTGGLASTVKDAAESTSLFTKEGIIGAQVQKAYALVVGTSTGAMKTFKLALAATGIGLIVIALGLLITNFDKVKEAVYKFIPPLKIVGDIFSNLIDGVTDFIGVTSQATRELEKMVNKSEKLLKKNEDFLDINGDKYDDYTKRKIQANIDYNKKVLELNKDETRSEEEKIKLLKGYRDKADREIVQAEKDRQTELQKVRKEAADKAKEEQDKAEEKARKAKEDAKKEKEEKDKKAKEEKERLDKQYNDFQGFQGAIRRAKEAQVKIEAENQQSGFDRLEAVSDSFQAKIVADNETTDAILLYQKQNLYTELGNAFAASTAIFDEGTREQDALQETSLQIAKITADGKIDTLEAVSAASSVASKLFASHTAASKALGIASATIDTYRGIMSIWGAASMGNPIVDIAVKTASSAVIAAQGIASVKNILKVKVPGATATGGAAPTAQPVGTAGATPPTTTSTPVVDLQRRNDNNNLSGGQAVTMAPAPQEIVVKAIVSETEISKSQQTVANIKNKSEL